MTRSFDNSAWEKKARERLHLPFRQLIGVSNLIPPTDTDVKAGQVRALVSVGESSLKQYLIMTISASQLLSHDFTLTDAKFSGQTFEGGDIRGSVSLDSEIPSWHAGAAIASFYSAVQGRLTVLASDDPSRIQSTQTVEAVRAQDHLLGFIQSFTKGNETIAFYQSQSQLIARTTAPGLDARDFAAIDRSSLIPGTVFNALFFPVTRGTGVSKDPAIYVDSTQLSSRRVYLWTIDKGHLVAPMRMNVEIPAGCRALAPRRFGERGEMSYVLLCPLGSDYELKTLTIE